MPAAHPATKANTAGLRRLLLIFATALLLVGCASGAGSGSTGDAGRPTLELPTAQPTLAPSPVSTRVLPVESLTPAPSPTITPIPGEARGMVVDVIDGDTLAVVLDGDPLSLTYEVRLLGIDSPPNLSTDPWGVVAAETSAALANLKVVRLVRDETDFDDDGYLLRYVYVGSDLLNAKLVERGLARVDISAPDDRLETTLRAAETTAKNEELGIWGSEPPTPTPERMPQAATTEPVTATVTLTAPATVEATVTVTATTTVTPAATTGSGGSPTPQQTPTRTPTAAATPTEAAAPESDELQGPSN